MQATELFATPLRSCHHPDRNQLQTWSEHILSLERNATEGVRITNQGGWHSPTNLLDDPALGQLFLWIANRSQQAMHDLGLDLEQGTPCFNNAWAMVNREGDSVRAHLHPNSLFSGALYLKAPRQPAANRQPTRRNADAIQTPRHHNATPRVLTLH